MKNLFVVFFHAKIKSLVLETQHLRIMFWDFGFTWDAWCQKPNIYELFWGFWTHLGCLVSETQHLRIIFGIWTHLEVLVGSDHSRLRSR